MFHSIWQWNLLIFVVALRPNILPSMVITTIQVPDVNCTDDITNCHEFGNDICTDYKPWATAHCSRHCGFCTGATTPPPPCVNTIANCAEFGTYICTSVDLIGWTKKNCAQYCGLCGGGQIPTEPKTTPTPMTAAAAATVESGTANLHPTVVSAIQVPDMNCTDEQPNCHQYGNDICTDYKPWAIAHCSRRCGFCTGHTTTPPPCKNTRDNCAEFGSDICTSLAFLGWTKENCALYCGLCGGGQVPTEQKTTPTPMTAAAIPVSGATDLHPTVVTAIQVPDVSCTDQLPNCHDYGNDICHDYTPWAIAHCSRHCGFCTGASTTPPPCVNTKNNCAEYGTYICTSVALIGWTKQNCAKYCGLCSP